MENDNLNDNLDFRLKMSFKPDSNKQALFFFWWTSKLKNLLTFSGTSNTQSEFQEHLWNISGSKQDLRNTCQMFSIKSVVQ